MDSRRLQAGHCQPCGLRPLDSCASSSPLICPWLWWFSFWVRACVVPFSFVGAWRPWPITPFGAGIESLGARANKDRVDFPTNTAFRILFRFQILHGDFGFGFCFGCLFWCRHDGVLSSSFCWGGASCASFILLLRWGELRGKSRQTICIASTMARLDARVGRGHRSASRAPPSSLGSTSSGAHGNVNLSWRYDPS